MNMKREKMKIIYLNRNTHKYSKDTKVVKSVKVLTFFFFQIKKTNSPLKISFLDSLYPMCPNTDEDLSLNTSQTQTSHLAL